MTINPRATRRGSRFDWVKFDFELARDGSVEPTDKALYAAIASFVDVDSRESPETASIDLNVIPLDVPTRKRLAACIGKSVDTVDRATKRLEDRGLLRVHKQADPANPRVMLPSEYELLDHELWDQKAADRAARRAARRSAAGDGLPGQGGGRISAATPGGVDAATPGRTGAAVKDEREVEEEKEVRDGAVSPRSGGERRRQTTGSRGVREGGSAASGKTSPPLPQAQRQAVQAVRDLLPPDLNRALGDKTPVNIQAGIIAALAAGTPRERTVEQLVQYRLTPRWERYWAVRFYAGELTPKMPSGRLKEPFGPLAQMLADTPECGNLSCENRHDFVTETACQQCEMRKVDRRADRAKEHQNGAQGAAPQSEAPSLPMPSPRASQAAWWDCKMCPASAKGDPPVDGICRRCREKAAAAVAWTDPDAVTGEEPAAGPSAADLAAAAAEEQRLAEEAALDARLRAEQAERYGTPEQQAMYATSAPF